MRVVVTGSSGYLGLPTVSALRKRGVDVLGVCRHRDGPDKDCMQLDVADEAAWERLLHPKPPDRLVHLAWDHLNDYDNPRHLDFLYPRHLAFLKWCADADVRDLTVAGTCFEYGTAEGEMLESAPTNPATGYGMAKDRLRRELEKMANTGMITLKWARIFYVKSGRGSEKGVLRLIREAGERGDASIGLTHGRQLRDYIGRAEIGEFMAQFCLQDEVSGIVNCCSGKPVSIRQLVEGFAKEWPSLQLDFGRIRPHSYESGGFWGSRDRMDRVLGSKPAFAVGQREGSHS